jgi:alcohol dehydrogenase (NADP+)
MAATPSAPVVPSLPLLGGAFTMPVIGLGTWRTEPALLHAAIVHAIKAGYRHLDCAALYFNEHLIGAALKEVISEGIVKREDLFITSKLMPTDMHVETAIGALDKTLASLGTSYVDLYLLHWPMRFPTKPSAFPVPPSERLGYDAEEIAKVWRLLEGAVDDGRIRSLGVSNFSAPKMADLWSRARIRPSVNQVEMHPALQQQELLAWHKHHGVVVTTYCPLGSPSRPPTFRHDADPDILNDPVITGLAAKHSKTPAQVVLRWAVQRGTVPLPKSTTPSRLDENIAIFDFSLSEGDMAEIAGMDCGYRFSRGQNFVPEGQTWEQLWDDEKTKELAMALGGGAAAGAGPVGAGAP